MMQQNKSQHWNKVFSNKKVEQFSWYQPKPEVSLALLADAQLAKDAGIIDIGGGDSFFVDHLLDLGYSNITVLDISEKAIERAKNRLGPKANKVKWIIQNSAEFTPTEKYDFWHDRAAFHFLTRPNDIAGYVKTVGASITPGGLLVLGTFSKNGPDKCSGIEITQYSEESMTELFRSSFQKIKCFESDHHTPSGKIQKFIFGCFIKT